MKTLINFLKTNKISSLITTQKVVESSYTHHYDGDSNNTTEGFAPSATVGDVVWVDGVQYVCYNTITTSPEHKAWCGDTKSSYWMTVEDATKLKNKTSANLLALVRCNLPQELINLPINWANELKRCKYLDIPGQFAEGTKYLISYYKDQIQIEEKKWSCYIQQPSTSSIKIVGQWNINTGENTTPVFVAYKKKQRFLAKLINLQEKGLSKKQAIAFMKAKIPWKWEIVDDLAHILSQNYLPKDLFLRLSQCDSHKSYNKLCENWAIDFFNEESLPRKTSYAALIAALK